MKSSIPVFTRQSPIPPASTVKKAHCHPSRHLSLSKKEKKTTLSPVRSKRRSSSQLHTPNPESQQLDKKHDLSFNAIDGQPVFAESWPSTECGFSPGSNTASSDVEAPKGPARSERSTVSSAREVQQDSVLAKYVERFRHGRPQSREERQQMVSAIGEEQVPFWWMCHSSLPLSSTPIKTTDKDIILPLKDDHDPAVFSSAGQRRHDRSPSPSRGSLSILSDTTQGEFDEAEIIHLQERASRLLLRGECNGSDGSVPVSSEGLGDSDFSSPVSVEELVQRPLFPSLIKTTAAKSCSDSVHAASSQKSVIPSLVPPTRPEEDILFQWRLRRKMEQAREWPQSLKPSSLHGSTFSWQAPSFNHPVASGQPYKQQQGTQALQFSQRDAHQHISGPLPETKEAQTPCPPAPGHPPFPAFVVTDSSVFQPQTIAHVPAHRHLLCDVLPCPIQSSHDREQQNISRRSDESHTKVVYKKTQIPEKAMSNNFRDVPLGEHVSSLSPALSRVKEKWPSHQKRSERSKKKKSEAKESERSEKMMMSVTEQKKSARSSSHQRLPKKVTELKNQVQQEGRREFPRKSCTDDHEPTPSPIHSALGQVVSEVLFPLVDSPPAQRIPVSSVSPPCTISAPPQAPVSPCSAQNSMEVISQLLQEAEDSDEKEFEDDPLLQVLRKQRKWVKEQISEVDSVLKEFLEGQQVT
ncbi:proline and serine-rich protein 3 [Brachyistius frenatus]|uniref:proline and serine-rich protein 3 n=1 Tax=Brachyistius frenatus TaxID=100188 RepID=UPI0037E85390